MRRTVVLLAFALAAAACGGTSQATTPSPSPSPSPVATSPSPSPTDSGQAFALKGIKTGASGTILLTKGAGTFTVELHITGLAADSSHISHVHVGSCEQPGGIVFALNQVVADGTGAAVTRTEVHASYPPASGHWYVVVHAGPDMQGTNATYLLCGDLF